MNPEKARADETALAKTAKNEALPAISSTTGGLPSAPSPTDVAAWSVPATRGDCQAAATHLITATEMGLRKGQRASDDEKVAFIRLLASYDYTRAELIQAMREVPRDPERFGGRGATVQDVERIVKRSRKMRARLGQSLDSEAMQELLAEYPQDLDKDDFKCCGFNKFDEPLYRHAPDVKRHAGEPKSTLPEKTKPKRTGGGDGEARAISDFITKPASEDDAEAPS